jgi:hypothetical protein
VIGVARKDLFKKRGEREKEWAGQDLARADVRSRSRKGGERRRQTTGKAVADLRGESVLLHYFDSLTCLSL